MGQQGWEGSFQGGEGLLPRQGQKGELLQPVVGLLRGLQDGPAGVGKSLGQAAQPPIGAGQGVGQAGLFLGWALAAVKRRLQGQESIGGRQREAQVVEREGGLGLLCGGQGPPAVGGRIAPSESGEAQECEAFGLGDALLGLPAFQQGLGLGHLAQRQKRQGRSPHFGLPPGQQEGLPVAALGVEGQGVHRGSIASTGYGAC
ncbi:hypothetical protein Mcate_01018 [Meiothermus taiwanensis]|uniref:Uncharacterized protein n=1 Tax=Meiothermus taiwanensis TaxID=172827 RepID=A0A399E031_9DEIN|nr:hypothetical protein Mcate_01018 [Meiothermus taiwanensis]